MWGRAYRLWDVDSAAGSQRVDISPGSVYTWALCESVPALARPPSQALPSLLDWGVVLSFSAWLPPLPPCDPPKFINLVVILSCLPPCSRHRRQIDTNINVVYRELWGVWIFPSSQAQGFVCCRCVDAGRTQETPGSETEGDHCSRSSGVLTVNVCPLPGCGSHTVTQRGPDDICTREELCAWGAWLFYEDSACLTCVPRGARSLYFSRSKPNFPFALEGDTTSLFQSGSLSKHPWKNNSKLR